MREGRRDEGRGWERDEGISILCGNIISSSRQRSLIRTVWRKKGYIVKYCRNGTKVDKCN